MESVKVRCRVMHEECMRFEGCHTRVVGSNPTGVSGPDITRLVTGIYNGVDMGGVKNDCRKQFRI